MFGVNEADPRRSRRARPIVRRRVRRGRRGRRATGRVRTPGRRRAHAALVRAVRSGRRDRDRSRAARRASTRRSGRSQPTATASSSPVCNRARTPSTARRPDPRPARRRDQLRSAPDTEDIVTERTLKDRAAIVGVGATPYYRRGRSLPADADGAREQGDPRRARRRGPHASTTSTASRSTAWASTRRSSRSARRPRGALHRRAHRRRRRRGRFGRARGGGDRERAWPSASCQRDDAAAGRTAASARRSRRVASPARCVLRAAVAGGCFHPTVGADGARARCSRCSCSGTCTSTARRASTSPRSRSRPATTRSARPTSLMQEPLTREQYFDARMISDPLCLYDFCMECDGAVAVVTTSAERARTCGTRRCT